MKGFFIALFLSCGIGSFAQTFIINFESNEAVIPDSSYRNIALYILKNAPDSVLIYGHCDSIGSDAFNKDLSKRRALAVKQLCTSNTVDAKNIKVMLGKGEHAPIAENSTDAGRQANRRVELLLYKKTEIAKVIPEPIAAAEVTPSLIPEKEIVIKKNEEFILPAIKFYALSHQLMPESEPSLQKVLELLEKNPSIKLLITGHVCCTTMPGQDGDDMELKTSNLSVTRAKAVKEYLVSKGIDAKRLKFTGMKGERKLFPDEKTVAEKEANRRVEFKILEV